MPVLKPASNLPSPATQVTTLPNGLRVASEENYGQVHNTVGVFMSVDCFLSVWRCGLRQVSSVGLFIDAGSMFEDGMPARVVVPCPSLFMPNNVCESAPVFHFSWYQTRHRV